MLIENLTHPLVSDFLGRITGSGDTYFNAEASSRINDFVEYISSLVTDNGDDFAFYPLRREQNIGKGNQIFGVGNMASGTNIIFPKNINWNESGIALGQSTNDVGIINFSGKLTDKKFEFRRNTTSVFYFLKHNRPKFEQQLYRDGKVCPYFWFDDSLDNFGVFAPEFSTSDLRTTGTTYIYDDIYGGDKKGYQMDFSSTDEAKFGIYSQTTGRAPYGTGTITASQFPPVSFYEMDNNDDNFVCINAVIQENLYSLRSFFGKDYRVLTGFFPQAYTAIRVRDPITNEIYTENLFPRRMVIGAGVSNEAVSGYNINGIEHICAGILILQGDYTNQSRDIAENMAEAIGIKIRQPESFDTRDLGNIFLDNVSCTGTIKSISYYDYTTPKNYETYSDYDDILKFETAIYSGAYIDYGRWTYNVINSTTGELRSPDKIPDTLVLSQVNVNEIFHDVGQLSIYAPVFGSFINRGVAGFVSGYREKISESEYRFTRFGLESDNSSSGFYLVDNSGKFTGQEFFPPKKEKFQLEITGYISGVNYEVEGFVPFNESSNLYSSGYFIDNNIYKFPKLDLIPQYITGYISGFLFENGIFSGFDNKYIDCSSGYFYNENQYEFLPKKVIDSRPITGFLLGIKSGDYFSGFYREPNGEELSGVFMANDFSDPTITEQFFEVYFPTGNMFSGFEGVNGFDNRLGFNYSGFFPIFVDEFGEPILDINGNQIELIFNGSSGFVDLNTPGPFVNTTIGLMTGLIGTNNYLNFSGAIDGFSNIEYPSIEYGHEYSGFFVVSSGFLGTQIDPETQERNTNGTGIFTGLIGHINTFQYVDLTGFENEPEFIIGGLFTGFFASTPSFSGIYGDYGTGIQTGIIGSKFSFLYDGIYSGISGFSQFSEALLDNTTIDLTFPNGSGFSGLNSLETGFGVMSGLITTGRSPLLFGDPIYFRPYIISISFDSSSINFSTGDYIFGDLKFTGIIPDITGLTYVSGLRFRDAVDSGTNTTGDYIISGAVPEIIGLNYFFSAASSYIDFFDFNSRDYILRVEAYEGQELESGVRVEINKFISGLKTDNIWDKISDACLLAGPRTVSGIFIPLKSNGKTGINYNFVSEDYSRASGLLGDGSSKYIDTQHLLNKEPTGSQHMAVYITQVGSSSNQYYIGAGQQYVTGSSAIYASGGTTLFQKSRASGFIGYNNLSPNTGLMATSRFNSGVWVARNTNSSETAFIYAESGAQPANVYVYANNNTGLGAGSPEGYSNARMSIYSIGTNVDILKKFEDRIYSYLTGIRSYIN